MALKVRLPFLRWSFCDWRRGVRNISRTGQVGDGREAAAVDYVLRYARAGDLDDVIATIDRFAYQESHPDQRRRREGPAPRRRGAPGRTARARPGTGHLLRLWRAADRPRRARCPGGLGGTRRGQRRERPADLGARRGGGPDHLRGRHHRRRRHHAGHPRPRSRVRRPAVWICYSSTTTRTPTSPTCSASSTAAGCIRAASSSPTTSCSPARRSTAPTCARQQGRTLEHRRAPDPCRVHPGSRIWCWSRRTWADRVAARPAGGRRPTPRAAR